MKKLLLLSPLLLAACAPAGDGVTFERLMDNPLYAERYYDDLTEEMVNLVLQEDPVLQDEEMKARIEETRVESLRAAEKAVERQDEGLFGQIVSDYSYAKGEVLLLDGILYIGPDFETFPGMDLRVYLSSVLDPREGVFPDESAVELGPVKNLYGEHAYEVPAGNDGNLRTYVLYDAELKRVYGFAQLSERR